MAGDPNEECAAQILDTVMRMMRSIGPDKRKHDPAGLTVHQFRGMKFVEMGSGVSLSDLAKHIGMTVSASSKIVDGLVCRGLIERATDIRDRRKLVLNLTEAGRTAIETVHQETVAFLAERISGLSPAEIAMVGLGMQILRSAFTGKKQHEELGVAS